MSFQIKTLDIEPRRQTFAYIARRFGADRPASRYEEATYDVQARTNFHYRPIWAPEYEIHDENRTAVVMADWYVFKDPRQFYYATYNQSRAAMNQVLDGNFDTVEERGMLARVAPEWLATAKAYLVPLRHYEWGANMNNFTIADYGYGTQITSAAAFHAADRLGMAQVLGRIGLLLDDQTGASLDEGHAAWTDGAEWQDLRRAVEDMFVVEDWFEVFVAQNLAMDGILHPLVFDHFDAAGQAHNGAPLSMLTGFMVDWFKDSSRWVDAVIKAAAQESDANRALLSGWYATWSARAVQVARPLADRVLGDVGMGEGAEAAVATVAEQLNARARKLGLDV
ncbi:MAG: aromatic/alkene monooxygenase hydroxylase subunit beta [Rhodobacterales bacterium]|nr:aromatic/alkene monooxygenase hydroxylase subunit beta [Rhodobacterales bacterium]